ncbi:glycosyltransferase 87 family protein [Raineyella fluvialis]|uniref:glycosyltransferase 87 family protein n=1 Tax=Raineyella fluvialis TaxID=2662261 RepID=UPI001E5983FF|nr:glycosyltransferase 87 family protein [Raineyella fluvialis]
MAGRARRRRCSRPGAIQIGHPERPVRLRHLLPPRGKGSARGGSPYEISGYYYTPLVAVVIAPLANVHHAAQIWLAMGLAAAVGAALIGAWACRPSGTLPFGLLVTTSLVTLLYSWPAVLEAWRAQVQWLVLLCIVTAALLSRRHAVASGTALGMAALIKTWPAVLFTWLLGRSALRKLPVLAAGAVATVIAVLMSVAVGGAAGIRAMVTSPLAGADQPLVSYSVWGLGKMAFAESGIAPPITVSPGLQWTTWVILGGGLACLAAVTLLSRVDEELRLFNLVFVVILAMPVSHFMYVMLPLPALWWWMARAMEHPRAWVPWIGLGTLGSWWVLVFRLSPAALQSTSTTWPTYLTILGSTLVAASVSIIAGAVWHPRQRPVSAVPDDLRLDPGSRLVDELPEPPRP